MEKQVVSVQIGERMAAMVRAIAEREEESVSAVLRRIIRHGLEHERRNSIGSQPVVGGAS